MKLLKIGAPLTLSIFAFTVYQFSAAPFMLWLDAPRFVSAIVTLGVANPPEPLYVLLAHPFIYLPFGSVIFRIQLFSALTAAVTLLVLYRLILLVLKNLGDKGNLEDKGIIRGLAALFGTAMLAFSYQFWSQAQNIETFMLVVLIEVVSLYLLLSAQTGRRFFINLSLIALILGLATGTNPVIISIIPAILWVMWSKRQFLSIGGFAAWFLIGALATVAIHLYIPIRAQANPFLNYWTATDFTSVWNLSTGSGLNVFVPEIGRVNGFTLSPEIFFKSTFHYIAMWLVKFTPLLLPFMIAGAVILWKRNRFYFIFCALIILTNWLFSALYFSGNQESWFLVSDVIWVILGGIGYYYLVTQPQEFMPKKLYNRYNSYNRYNRYILILALVPLIVWFPFLQRRGWVLTEDYISNLYRPLENQKAIIFGSSDLYDSISFLAHDVKQLPTYRPNIIPITDNLLYILKWYREHLKATTDLKIPDDRGLKYDSALEYSQFVMEFFSQNLSKYKIYVTVPALRNNFLQAYRGQNLGPSLKIDEQKFKLIPQGMVFEVVPKESSASSNLTLFDYQFKNKGFPKVKPFMLEQTYQGELTGVLNEYAYSAEALGDELLREGKPEEAFKYYQQAFDLNPKNAEIVSRLGNYYGSIGNHAKAAEFFEKALKIESRNTGLLFNLAISYENTGRVDKAISNYNKILQFSKGQEDQIAQLARVRLKGLQSATPSAQVATKSSSLQEILTPKLHEGVKLYQNPTINIQFTYPQGFILKEDKNNLVNLTNNLKDKDELTFIFYGRKLASPTESLEDLSKNLPFSLEGQVLITQQVGIEGFEALGKTYGGQSLTFLLLMKRGENGVVIKIYPGDSNKSAEFNEIIQSIKPIN